MVHIGIQSSDLIGFLQSYDRIAALISQKTRLEKFSYLAYGVSNESSDTPIVAP